MKNRIRKWCSKKSKACLDIILSGIILIVTLSLAHTFEAFEWFAEWSKQYEDWHTGEIASVLIVLTFFFTFFSWRRWRESRHEITQRKMIEEELKKGEQFNFNLIEQSPHPVIIIDLDRKVTRVNKALESLTGYPASEIAGLGAPYPWWTDQDTEQKSAQDFQAALACKGQHFEEQFRKKSGELFWVQTTPMAIIIDGQPQGYMNTWVDITKRKQLEEKLSESNEFNSSLIEQSPHPILVTDWDTTITKVNQALEQLTGYSSSEIIGTKIPFPWYSNQHSKEKMKRDIKAALTFKSQSFEEEFRNKNGEVLWVEVTPMALRIDGKPSSYMSMWTDITKRKKMEKELQERYHQEKKLRQELEEEMRKRIDFTRIIVHELKTPLTSIMVSSDLLKSEVKEQLLLELAQSINRSAVNLNGRIDELLDMARGEMGTLKLNPKVVDPRQLLSSLIDDMTLLVSNRRQSLTLEAPDSLPQVKADEDRLRQIVLNFLSNASKFTPEGTIITLRAKEQASSLIVEVEDNGPGIYQQEQERLFKPYYRVNQSKERISGLGLGLALSKTLVELHQGKIWVKSKSGQGSTFGFSIPLKATNDTISQKSQLELHTV